MKYHKSIFNKKTLSRVLNRIGDASDPDIKEKQAIISNWIRALQNGKLDIIKETSIDQKFLDDFFVRVLGYQGVIGDSEVWNMIPQQKMKLTSNRADGALGFFSNEQEDIRAVIELKDANTELDSPQHRRNDKRTPVQQAFGYDPEAGKSCKWVIVSNFKELRLYHHSSSNEYEVFSIEKLLEPETFKKFYFLLSKENLIAKDGESEIEKLYRNNTAEEEQISTKFYGEYKAARIHLFEHLKRNNPDKDEMLLLEKTQKILDRFIFVCFCEDKGLLPARIFRGTLEQARTVIIELADKNWQFVQALFKAINDGNPEHDINKFDGGLFAPDEELDSLKLSDAVFEELAKITDYDFETDLNVNILGHIFEQSISDLEEIKAEFDEVKLDKKKGKRKKEGIYYTPEYITHYIVENAIGGWLEDRKKELGYYGLPELTEKDYESVKVKKAAYNANIKRHLEFWEAYKTILKDIKVLDPACGSGAFLNQAFDYLYGEGQQVNEEIAKLKRGTYSLVDLDKSILSDNLYGVDLNKESVEITKLSLWLKTASKQKELTALDENIKCGNSLIGPELNEFYKDLKEDNSEEECEKQIRKLSLFDWKTEFPGIMANGGFDVVIGNPPYGAELNKKAKDFLRNKYPELQFKIDTYSVFILKSIELLRNNSYCYFIIPNTILDNYFEEKIREILLKQNQVKEVIDLSDSIFEEAVVHSMILGFKKAVKSHYLIKANTSKNLNGDYLCIPNTYFLEQDKFVFAIRNYNQKDILNILAVNSTPLKNILDIRQAIKTGNDEVYITHDKKDEYFKPILRGRDIRKWSINNPELYVNYGNHLACPRDSEIFEQPKILLRESGNRIIATFDNKGFYIMSSLYNAILTDNSFDLKYVLCLLNSRLFQYQLKLIAFEKTKGTFTKARIFHYYELPVKKSSSEQQQPFIEKADKMLTHNQKLWLTQKEFFAWLKIQYGLEKVSKKLESFYELHEESFFVELKKKLPKENRNLSPKQTVEIKQCFEVYRQKMVALKNELEKTDKEIDELVYELYGLTKDEIKIVEEIQ